MALLTLQQTPSERSTRPPLGPWKSERWKDWSRFIWFMIDSIKLYVWITNKIEFKKTRWSNTSLGFIFRHFKHRLCSICSSLSKWAGSYTGTGSWRYLQRPDKCRNNNRYLKRLRKKKFTHRKMAKNGRGLHWQFSCSVAPQDSHLPNSIGSSLPTGYQVSEASNTKSKFHLFFILTQNQNRNW